jgi:hypothetical protein
VKTGSKAVGVKNYADASSTMDDPAVLAMMANWGRRRAVGRPSVPTAIRVRVRTPTPQRPGNWWIVDGQLIMPQTGFPIVHVLALVQAAWDASSSAYPFLDP